MNNDLISRNALIQHAYSAVVDGVEKDIIDLSDVDNAPTVDTACPHCDSGYAQGYSDGYLQGKEERPQGEWIYLPKDDAMKVECPFCHERKCCISNYCDYCGSKMKGVRNEQTM